MKKISLTLLLLIGLALFAWKLLSPLKHSRVVDISSVQTVNDSLSNQDSHNSEQKNSAAPAIVLSDYQSKLDRDFKSLPTMGDLQNLTFDEVHHTPEIIKNGGEIIGKIQDEAEIDSSKRVDAMSFFKRCTQDNQLATAIRAVCLNKIYKLVPAWKIPAPLSNVSDEVSDLALKLP